MKVSESADLKVGDVLYGVFPVMDGRGDAPHYALVIGRRDGHAIGVVGTSLKCDARRVQSTSDVFVVSPWTAHEPWSDTGLMKATIFDMARGTRVLLNAARIAKAAPRKTGCVAASLGAFVKECYRK
ncbi:MAG TPA: hypothetical protein VFQ88_14065 [Nevskiaceae bacterium]|nr:hypothetical protein [Nevskiaceae bacterium]